MHIFLTGATGFVGSHFTKIALEKNHTVLALKRSVSSKLKLLLKKEPKWIVKSFPEIKINDFGKSEVLIHLAAHSANVPYDTLENCLKFNVFETLNLFNKAYEAGIRNFVITGSCFEYGKKGEEYDYIPPDAALFPTLSYPTSKAAASIILSQWALEKKVSLKILRLFQIYGEGELKSRLWPSLVNKAKRGEDLSMTLGEQIRDFINVKDVANKILEESLSKNKRMILIKNIGSGKPTRIRDFALQIWNDLEAKGKINFGSIPYRNNEVMRYVPDINKEYYLE